MRIILFIVFSLSLAGISFGQNDYVFLWDKNASSISNAENLLSVHRIIYEFEKKTIRLKYWDERNWKRKVLGMGYRFTKTVLIDFPIDYLVHIHQHEIFGHGHRYREFEYEDNSYNIELSPPYGSGSGFAVRGSPSYARNLGTHEEIAIRSGGMESGAVLANTLKRKWLKEGAINYRESLLYLSTFHDYYTYIFVTQSGRFDVPGNDVSNYLRTVNGSYGINDESLYQLTLDDLSKSVSINLANTFQLFSAYAYFKIYLLDGKEKFQYPSINIGNLKWLPAIRFGLTPFGSEMIVENYLKNDRSLLTFDIRIGDNKLDNFWGGGVSFYRNISDKIQFTSYANFWVQPAMELGGTSVFNTKEGFGGRLLGEINLHFGHSFPLGLYGQLGYKSAGFLEGEQLNKGLILRLGMSIRPTT